MEQPVFRKPRQFFDTAQRPSHVTFDDGKHERRNYPWAHYVEGRWSYGEPETIKLTIGDWLVVIMGHRIEVLYRAIADHTLAWVCAHPEFVGDADHDPDSFATEIRFLQAPAPTKRKGQIELDLDI
jgi:hypothetical protein